MNNLRSIERLPSDDDAIAGFRSRHAPLRGDLAVEEAAFWTPAQATMLREELLCDADWAEVVNQLNEALCASG